MKSFKVSIILPVYNVEKYLENCLDSLLAQTLDDIEIVAVNDGSTDKSLQILEAYQERHPEKLFIYSTENHGVSRARNYGFAHSHGQYIWFVDSDDFVEPDACRILYEKATADRNDLVLFRFNSVAPDTGERKPSPAVHHNQNFTIAKKPYELANMVLYPWNKLIRRTLFQGIEFPEGIRFEDVPVSFQLYTRAKSIGVVNTCFYNYIRSIGFSEALTATTFDICKAYTCVIHSMKELGFYDRYYHEISYVAVRHILFRLKKLLTNYETNKKQLKLDFVKTVYAFLDTAFPDWRDNFYVRYTLPAPVAKMFYFYTTPEHFLNFIENCDSQPPQQQKKWLKDYKASLEKKDSFSPAEMIRLENTSAQFYHFAYTGSLAPDPEQIFLETKGGRGISSWILDVLIMLAQNFGEHHVILSLSEEQRELFIALLIRRISGTALDLSDFIGSDPEPVQAFLSFVQPQSEEYGKALALSGYILTDGPLPYYFQKEDGQFCLLYCGRSLYPETFQNTPSVHVDTGLWQHTMFMADCLYFNNEQNREIYQKECMVKGICPTPYVIGTNAGKITAGVSPNTANHFTIPPVPDKIFLDSPQLPPGISNETLTVSLLRDKIRRSLRMDGCQTILCAPLLPGSYLSDARQTFRGFMSALYILDQEFTDQQILYLHLDPALEMDVKFSDFVHIKEMPHDFDVADFAQACDIFLSDYHSALEKDFIFGTRKVRFVCGSFQQRDLSPTINSSRKRDDYFPNEPFFDNAPELACYLRALWAGEKSENKDYTHTRTVEVVSQEEISYRIEIPAKTTGDPVSVSTPEPQSQAGPVSQPGSSAQPNPLSQAGPVSQPGSATQPEPLSLPDTVRSLLNGRPLPYQDQYQSQVTTQDLTYTADEGSHRPRVLFFTGRKLSHNLVHDFNELAAQAPEKDFWLAYNDFRNPDSARYLAQLAPECSYLSLKPEPEKSRKWKLASVLTSRMGLSALYPITHLLALGKEEYIKTLGNATFDEVIITSTDSIKTVATLLAAAPVASYTFDTFNPERYSNSRPYRNQIAFLCRLLKNAGCLELPEELTGMKLAHSSAGSKDKKPL